MLLLEKATQLAWRKFLATDAGTEGMLFLRERVPSIARGDANSVIFDAGRVEGYKMALDTISEVIAIQEKKEINVEND